MTKTQMKFTAVLSALVMFAIARADNPLDKQISQPAVEAATVISDFATNHDEAATKYAEHSFMLQGRIIAVGGAMKSSGHSGAHLQIGPSNADTKSTMVLWVEFPSNATDSVTKLAKGDLVQIEVTYTPTPTPATAHEIRGFTGASVQKKTATATNSKAPQLRDQMVDWVRKNQSLKPAANGGDNALVRKMSAQIDGSLDGGNDFSILFGPGLVKSKKATALCEQDGTMLVQEFTDEQFAGTKLGAMSTTVMDSATKAMRLPPLAELSSPTLEGNGNWNITQPLKGTVKLKPLAHFPTDTKNLAVRMVCYAGNLRLIFVSPLHEPPGGDSTAIQFEGGDDARTALMSAKPPGPRVVFFEVVQMPDTDKKLPEKVISEPAAVILNITDK